MTRNRILDQLAHQARATFRTARIDLDAFLALADDERAERWQQWDRAAKAQAVAQMLTCQTGDWDQSEVERWIAHYDVRWGTGDPTQTDLAVPPAETILEAARERADVARQQHDIAHAELLDLVRQNVAQGASLHWQLGELLIQLLTSPTALTRVSRAGCTCASGAAGQVQCWHAALFDLLVDLQEDTADLTDSLATLAA